MELTAIQIVTTAVLIVAAVAVALFCDYLRNRSQQLQELAVELNVRKQMSVATAATPAPAPSAATAAAARNARESAPVAERPSPPVETKMNRNERHSTETVKPALAGAAELASVRGAGRPRRRPVPPPDAPLPRLDEMNPRQALADWLDQRAAKAPAKSVPPQPARIVEEPALMEEPVTAPVFVEETAPEPAPAPVFVEETVVEPAPARAIVHKAPAVEPAPTPVIVHETPTVETAPAFVEEARPAAAEDIRDILRRALAKRSVPARPVEAVPVAAATPAPEPAPEPVKAPEALPAAAAPRAAAPAPKTVTVFLSTRKIDNPRREAPAEPAPEPRFEIIDGAAPSTNFLEVVLPAGMQDHATLDRALASGKPFRGLVVSVGVNDVEGRSARNNDLLQSIGYFIRGLLTDKEFACRTGEAEFVIVCPGREGSDAQRRLNQIAEQLWDYQLRGVSTWSILFSWGGADVHHQPLAEAIAMASERMYQTRRGRKTVSVEALRPLRQAAM